MRELDRLNIQSETQDILDVAIRKVTLPVAAGRNLAVLVEAAVRNYILQLRGIDSTRDFIERQTRFLREQNMQLILISGLSGSGKSVALKILEDSGFTAWTICPPPCCRSWWKTSTPTITSAWPSAWTPAARRCCRCFPPPCTSCAKLNIDLRLLFLEAKTETLIKALFGNAPPSSAVGRRPDGA